jgi:tetratricopeptide (TPR) repeat protein
VKTKPNDPCPCGSGKKHKRCCGRAGLAPLTTLSSVVHPPLAFDTPGEFPPFDPGTEPTAPILEPSAYQTMMSMPQQEFIRGILRQLRNEDARAGGQAALDMIETLPESVRRFLYLIVQIEVSALNYVGRPMDAVRCLFRFLIDADDERLWFSEGLKLQPWLSTMQGADAEESVADLRRVCGAHGHGGPQLLTGITLISSDATKREALDLLSAAIAPQRWNAYPEFRKQWLPAIAMGVLYVVRSLAKEGQHDEAARYGRMMLAHPWGSAPMHHGCFDMICESLFEARLDRELQRFCDTYRKRRTWGLPRYWLAKRAMRLQDRIIAISHFTAAFTGAREDLDDLKYGRIATALLELGSPHDARRALNHVKDRDERYAVTDAMCLEKEGRWGEASERWKEFGALHPEDAAFDQSRLTALFMAGQHGEVEAFLRQLLEDPGRSTYPNARLQLAILLCLKGRRDEAQEVIQPIQDGNVELPDDPLVRGARFTLEGDLLAHRSDFEGALAAYETAYANDPIPMSRRDIVRTLIRLGRYEQAELWLANSNESETEPDDGPKESTLLQLLIDDHRNNAEAVLAGYATLDLEWLRTRKSVAPALGPALRALLDLNRPLEALELCELAVDDIAEDAALRELHIVVMRRAREKALGLADDVEEKKARLAESEHLRVLVEKHRSREQLRFERRQAHLKAMVGAAPKVPQAEQTAKAEEPQLPAWLEGLGDEPRAQLLSAELIWNQLRAHRGQDHSPVVVQLARVLEREVNDVLVDPLVRRYTDAGGDIERLPGRDGWPVAPTNNKLSLNQCAELLTTDHEQRERDGSTTVVRAPRSSETHRKVLAELWDALAGNGPSRRYFERRFPGELREVARVRNRAGHAGGVVPRQEASVVRKLVMGSHAGEGMLMWLLRARAASGGPKRREDRA